MTPERLKEIKDRLGKRLAGRWLEILDFNVRYVVDETDGTIIAKATGARPAECNLILHAPQDMEDLIAELELIMSIVADACDGSAMFHHGYLEGQKASTSRLLDILQKTNTGTPAKRTIDMLAALEPIPYQREE